MFERTRVRCALSLVLMTVAVGSAFAVDLTGAGASSPYPVYAKWAARYYQLTGHRVNYQSIGSGGGQQQIIAGTVDFGASDVPMGETQLTQNRLVQFPAVMGGTVPVVNLPGISAGQLRLTGPVLADIFLGRIQRWDAPAIARLNPGLALPAQGILVVHRSDGSGTTYNWTDYLVRVSPAWQQVVGRGKAVKWPVGQGGKGNEGVAAYVRQLRYSIGYVEYAYAHQNHLAWTLLKNRAGAFVNPGPRSFAAAAAGADWQAAPGMGLVLNDQPGQDAWPVTAATFILVPRRPERRGQAQREHEVLRFFDWAWREGGPIAEALDYVPLPGTLVPQIHALWAQSIRGPDDRPLWP